MKDFAGKYPILFFLCVYVVVKAAVEVTKEIVNGIINITNKHNQ